LNVRGNQNGSTASGDGLSGITALRSRQVRPRGLDGGHNGAKSRLTLHPGKSQAEIMPSSIRLELAAGDTFEIRAAAGGGFGPPAQRDPDIKELGF
jgi:N-methylhydantoinase B/oxoprolinase/acetone carboxylase alpha subunit